MPNSIVVRYPIFDIQHYWFHGRGGEWRVPAASSSGVVLCCVTIVIRCSKRGPAHWTTCAWQTGQQVVPKLDLFRRQDKPDLAYDASQRQCHHTYHHAHAQRDIGHGTDITSLLEWTPWKRPNALGVPVHHNCDDGIGNKNINNSWKTTPGTCMRGRSALHEGRHHVNASFARKFRP